MKRFIIAATLVISAALAASGTASATNYKVDICHATGSSSNPYVQVEVARAGLNGHDDHALDIIPPFARSGSDYYPGKNWDAEGQQIRQGRPLEPGGPHDRRLRLDALARGGGCNVGGHLVRMERRYRRGS